jgi:hypothetical protein
MLVVRSSSALLLASALAAAAFLAAVWNLDLLAGLTDDAESDWEPAETLAERRGPDCGASFVGVEDDEASSGP